MTNLEIEQKQKVGNSINLNDNYLLTEYITVEKKNQIKKISKEDNFDISPKTFIGSSFSFFSENLINDKSESPIKKSMFINSRLTLLDDISNNSKSTNINNLQIINKNLSNFDLNDNKDFKKKKKKRVLFRDQIISQSNKTQLKSVRLPLVDEIKVESYKKYYCAEENLSFSQIYTKNKSQSFKERINYFTCNTIKSPCCLIF